MWGGADAAWVRRAREATAGVSADTLRIAEGEQQRPRRWLRVELCAGTAGSKKGGADAPWARRVSEVTAGVSADTSRIADRAQQRPRRWLRRQATAPSGGGDCPM